jgi:putative protease
MEKMELLAPAGDIERLKTAVHFGANAVYFAGKKYGLRAFASNFDEEGIKEAVSYCHNHNVKTYITLNILAHNEDFNGLIEYLKFLEECKIDGVIVSDLGIASYVKKYTNIPLHVSTQANITNVESAKLWVSLGAERLVLARELSLMEIRQIKDAVGDNIEIETFVHGAMCVSYSGRCLLSNYLTNRDSNKGECAQPCRWDYVMYRKHIDGNNVDYLPIEED